MQHLGRDDEATPAIERIMDKLSALPGVAGVVLGGSRARGTATVDSDIDIGLYYRDRERPAFDDLLKVAESLDDQGSPVGGSYGEWGPWINGGVWLKVAGFKTDILLRDVDRVRTVLHDCAAGRLQVDYQPGHPHAFVSSIYAGEVRHNIALHDPRGEMAELRSYVDPYPEALAAATIERFGWEPGFALGTVAAAASRGDTAYVTGGAFRAIACMVQVLHAVNRRYVVNEKGGVAAVAALPVAPHGFADRVASALARLTRPGELMAAALGELEALQQETMRLAADHRPGERTVG